MELGMIDEDALGDTLARLFRVPYAPAKVLRSLAAETVKHLPFRLAEKYRAVPISVDEGGLHVTMIEPRNVQSLDEISFATGYRVKPWISPEARIYQALDRYYGVRRSTRYVNLCRSLDATQSMRESEQLTRRLKGMETPPPAVRLAEGRRMGPSDPGEVSDLGGEYGYGRCWKEIAVDIGVDRRRPENGRGQELPSAQKLNPPSDGTVRPTIWESTDKLCRADKKQDAVDALLEFAAARMARAIFLGVNDEIVSVWDSRGADFDRRRKSRATFPLESEPLFQLLLGDECYRGPLPPLPSFTEFYKALGMESPREIMLVPIYFDDHLVAIFYGDGGREGEVTGEHDEFMRLFRMFPMAIHQILLRDNMRAIGYFFPEIENATEKGAKEQTALPTP